MKYKFYLILIFSLIVSNCKIHTPPIQEIRESNEYLNLSKNVSVGQSFIPVFDNMIGISFLLPGKAEQLELLLYEIENNTLNLKRKTAIKNFESGVRGSKTIWFDKITGCKEKKYYCELKITGEGYIKAGYSKKNVYESGDMYLNNSIIKDNELYFKIASETNLNQILKIILSRFFFDIKFVVFFACFSILLGLCGVFLLKKTF